MVVDVVVDGAVVSGAAVVIGAAVVAVATVVAGAVVGTAASSLPSPPQATATRATTASAANKRMRTMATPLTDGRLQARPRQPLNAEGGPAMAVFLVCRRPFLSFSISTSQRT